MRNSLPPEQVASAKKPKLNPKCLKVYCRLRPVSSGETASKYYVIAENHETLEIDAPDEILKKNQGVKLYRFTKVFPPASTQDEVYAEAVEGSFKSLFNEHKNGLIFSYGVTNAGKTHTIVGSPEDMGILPKLLTNIMLVKSNILNRLETPEVALPNYEGVVAKDLEVYLECFEIYNEDIFDLMTEQKKSDKLAKQTDRPKLKLREANRRIIVEDLRCEQLKNIEEAKLTIGKCLKNRQLASTLLNSSSSRSHTIFRISVKIAWEGIDVLPAMTESLGYICVVDLAGSERAKRTDVSDSNLKEAGGINSSLLVLGRCLGAMKKDAPVPFRDSKLTRFLSEFFMENSTITMITNINPREDDFIETLRVLNYASMAKEIKLIVSEFKALRVENSIKPKLPQIPDAKEEQSSFTKEQAKSEHSQTQRDPEEHSRLQEVSLDDSALIDRLCNKILARLDELMEKHAEKWTLQHPAFGSKRKVVKSEAGFCVQMVDVGVETTDRSNPKKKHCSLSFSSKSKRRSNSDEKNPCKQVGFHRISLKALASETATGSSTLKLETPDNRNKKSAFYTSLIKAPRLADSIVERISLKQYHQEMKHKYDMILDICAGNIEEARLYFKQEYNQSPSSLELI